MTSSERITVALEPGQLPDFEENCNKQGWVFDDIPTWEDTNKDGDLIWGIQVSPT